MTSRVRLSGVALALAGAIVLGSEPSASAQAEQSPKGLGFSFHALLAFARGGTLSGTSSNGGFQPGQYSASFGVWRAIGGSTYTALTDAFILFPGGPFPAGRQEISHSIRVSADGNRFTDQASLNYFDLDDLPASPQPPLIPGCATAAGLRVH